MKQEASSTSCPCSACSVRALYTLNKQNKWCKYVHNNCNLKKKKTTFIFILNSNLCIILSNWKSTLRFHRVSFLWFCSLCHFLLWLFAVHSFFLSWLSRSAHYYLNLAHEISMNERQQGNRFYFMLHKQSVLILRRRTKKKFIQVLKTAAKSRGIREREKKLAIGKNKIRKKTV